MKNGNAGIGGRGAKRFKRAFLILSLDLTGLFFLEMGLDLPDKNKFVSVVRSIISKTEHGPSTLSGRAEFVKAALQWMEMEHMQEVKTRLMHWVAHEYEDDPSDYPNTRVWLFTLVGCAGNPDSWACLDLPPNKKWLIHREFLAGTTSGDIESLVAQQRLKPLSKWDASVFARYGFDEDAMDPFLWIMNTIDMRRFRVALRRLLDRLSEDEAEGFWRSVQSIRQENDLTALADPRQLDKLETDWGKEIY